MKTVDSLHICSVIPNLIKTFSDRTELYGNISYSFLINGGQTLNLNVSGRRHCLGQAAWTSLLRTLQETDIPILLCPGICSVCVRFLLPPGLDLNFPCARLSMTVTLCIHPTAFAFCVLNLVK